VKRKFNERAAYNIAANGILNHVGAVYAPQNETYPYTVSTKAGPLRVSIDSDCCICTRFEDIEAAKQLDLGDRLNPHSGKWNWMGGDDHQGDMVDLAMFQQALRKIV
jgi:hypothetical protein